MAFYKEGLLAHRRTLQSIARGIPMQSSRYIIKSVALALVPSPIQRRLVPHLVETPPPRVQSTAYLDGLRGLASFIVFVHHYTCEYVPPYVAYYGVNAEKVPSSPLQLPFLRVVYSGRPMVHVFFVISGFVLSKKPLQLARARNYDRLLTALSSSTFRRAFRLFLPVVFSIFLLLILIRFGFCEHQPPKGTIIAQLRDYGEALERITQPWNADAFPTQSLPYDMHTWTLPVEMAMSMVLFITITGLARCRVPVRLAVLIGVMWYSFRGGHWPAVEFLGGAFIAEVALIQEETAAVRTTSLVEHCNDSEEKPEPKRTTALTTTPRRLFWWIQFAIALWICGWPNNDTDRVPGFRWMETLSPEPYQSRGYDFVFDWKAIPWFVIASLQIVFACHELPLLQRILNTEPMQYLGAIGFSLYLVHGPMMDGFGWRIIRPIWNAVGGQDEARGWGVFFVWIFGLLGFGIPCLWASDLFSRFVDRPCVEFARWLDRKCVEEQG